MMSKNYNLVFLHKAPILGGPASFQRRLINFLSQKSISHSIRKLIANKRNSILVIGGSRRVFYLIFCKILKIKIIHRVDGINWQHKVVWPGFIKFFKSELRLLLVYIIRNYLADEIIYQSNFIKLWWDEYSEIKTPNKVIYNGSEKLKIREIKDVTKRNLNIVCVEGELNGKPAYEILRRLKNCNIDVFGKYSPNMANGINQNVVFKGVVSQKEIFRVLYKYDAFLNLEVLPPCPNSVIEALSVGLPVLGFDNGSLKELVGDGGIIVDYGSNPWKLETPNVENLNDILPQFNKNIYSLSKKAWLRHRSMFDIEKVANKYLDICFD